MNENDYRNQIKMRTSCGRVLKLPQDVATVSQKKYIGSVRRGIPRIWMSEAEQRGRGALIVITEGFYPDITIWLP